MPLLASRCPLLASYGRELLVALRWRRLLGLWLFGIGITAIMAGKLALHGPLLPTVAISLLPLIFLAAMFSNLFGADGAGFQCHWILPIDIDRVMAAKERALWTLAALALLSFWGSLFVAHTVPPDWYISLFIVALQIAFVLWLGASGRVISVLAPRGVDARKISGDYLSPTAVMATGLSVGLFLAIAVGAAMLFDRGRIGDRDLAIGGGVILVAILLLRRPLARAAALVARHRREEILKSVLS
jgi:hypothetical protein